MKLFHNVWTLGGQIRCLREIFFQVVKLVFRRPFVVNISVMLLPVGKMQFPIAFTDGVQFTAAEIEIAVTGARFILAG